MRARESASAEQRALVLEAARECVGTRFHFNHRDPARAIDCVGVVRHCAAQAGLFVPSDVHYSRRTCFGQSTYALCRDAFDEVPVEDAKPGAVILTWLSRPERPQHLSIWTGKSLVHADTRAGRVREIAISLASLVGFFASFEYRTSPEPCHLVDAPALDMRSSAWRSFAAAKTRRLT